MRLIALHDVPPGLAQDEILDADIAMFIRQGQHAFFFREGYGHEPLYHYLAAPFAPLLGDNVLAIRLPSVFLGLLLIALTMRWARRDFGSLAAVIAGVGLAISWWPIVFSRVGIRPVLQPVLLVLVAWFWPLNGPRINAGKHRSDPSHKEKSTSSLVNLLDDHRPWLAGLFLGLSLYTYTAARVVFLIPLAMAIYLLLSAAKGGRHSPRQSFKSSILILVIALVLYLPMYLTLRADPGLQQRVEQLEGPLVALRNGDAAPILEMTLATLGVFSFTGDPRWTYSLPGRPLFDPLTAVFFYGGLLLALLRTPRHASYAFVLIWLGVTLIPSAVTPDAPSTVRLVGAMPIVYLLPGLAISWLYHSQVTHRASRVTHHAPRTTHHVSRITLFILLPILLALNFIRTIHDGFIRWPAELETRIRYQAIFLDVARHWQADPAGALVIAGAWYKPIDHDSVRRNLGHDLPARWVQSGAALVFPNQANSLLYVPEFAPLDPALAQVANLSPEPIYRSQGKPSFAIYELPRQPDVARLTAPITFDEAVTLLGYQLHLPQGDDTLLLFSYWRVEAELPWDLAIFVHLLAAGETLVAQHDGLDAAPTTLRPGDTFIQRHSLNLADSRDELPYSLQLGLYLRSDGRRLTHPGQPADRFIIAPALNFDGN